MTAGRSRARRAIIIRIIVKRATEIRRAAIEHRIVFQYNCACGSLEARITVINRIVITIKRIAIVELQRTITRVGDFIEDIIIKNAFRIGVIDKYPSGVGIIFSINNIMAESDMIARPLVIDHRRIEQTGRAATMHLNALNPHIFLTDIQTLGVRARVNHAKARARSTIVPFIAGCYHLNVIIRARGPANKRNRIIQRRIIVARAYRYLIGGYKIRFLAILPQ